MKKMTMTTGAMAMNEMEIIVMTMTRMRALMNTTVATRVAIMARLMVTVSRSMMMMI